MFWLLTALKVDLFPERYESGVGTHTANIRALSAQNNTLETAHTMSLIKPLNRHLLKTSSRTSNSHLTSSIK